MHSASASPRNISADLSCTQNSIATIKQIENTILETSATQYCFCEYKEITFCMHSYLQVPELCSCADRCCCFDAAGRDSAREASASFLAQILPLRYDWSDNLDAFFAPSQDKLESINCERRMGSIKRKIKEKSLLIRSSLKTMTLK